MLQRVYGSEIFSVVGGIIIDLYFHNIHISEREFLYYIY